MLHQIGIGTLGPVFRTYEPTRDRLVAVKAFRLDIVPEQAHALAAGLSRAARASLFHPSVVEPIEAGVEGTVAYRAEEYVAAESLDVAMRHYAPAPIERVLPFIAQLAGAIDFARAAGIGHGGLHPRDIFVTPDEARATGFGVVDALEQVGIRAPIRRPYSAPERIDGRAWSTQADVFSLAAITFELLTGKRPSGTGGRIGALPDGAYATGLHSVLARAMDDDPSKRHASALAFAGALEAASQGRPITEVLPLPVPAPVQAPEPAPLAGPAAPETKIPSPDIVKPEIPKAAVSAPPASEAPVAKPATVASEPAAPIAPIPADVPTAADVPIAADLSIVADLPIVAAGPTPGEFDIEAALDPVHEALEDAAERDVRLAPVVPPSPGRRSVTRGLFDQEPERHEGHEGREGHEGHEGAEAETIELGDRPYVATDPVGDEKPAEAAMFHAVEPETRMADPDDHGRPAILPFAVVSVLMLLIGFAAGYFAGSRARLALSEEATADTAASPAPQPAPAAVPRARPATADKAGQYSEQRVAPSPSAGAPASGLATGAATPSAAATTTTPSRAAPPVAAPAKGQIVVRSLPSHAGVTVNGTWRGRTPLTLDELTFGNYVVRLVQPGYKVAREEFTLNAREPSRTLMTRLELAGPAAPAPPTAPPAAGPAGFTGTLYVDSRPRGATVLIDGKSAGQTPLTLSAVAAGSHVVRIEMDGKKPVTAAPRVVAGQTERVTVSLEDK